MSSNIKTLSAFFQHPNFAILQTGSHIFDYALLKLATPVQPSSFVGFVCLPFDNSNMFVGNMLVASGWGGLYLDGESPPDLHAVSLTGTSFSDCSMAHSQGVEIIDAIHLCASVPFNTGGVCKGDSGGNLLVCNAVLSVVIRDLIYYLTARSM